MKIAALSSIFDQLEHTASRNEMVEILARLFQQASADEACSIAYLIQGRVAPLYEPVEFGIADKMMIRAIATAFNSDPEEVLRVFKKTGDLGVAAEQISKIPHEQIGLLPLREHTDKKLSVQQLFEILEQIAAISGAGSQDMKLERIASLLADLDALSIRFVVRIPLGKLRLGFSDMTVLDALSWMLDGSKSLRKQVERAYNVRPDLGYIAMMIKQGGIKGVEHVQPQTGTPILMARADRLSSAEEILEKIGDCAVEYKYDGLRLQVHYDKQEKNGTAVVSMYSRNLENITVMFPDIAEGIKQQLDAQSVILEGEVVAYNPQTGVFVPFQETMQRKRKYDIAEKAAEIPVKLFAFELLYCDGENFIHQPYLERKKKLRQILNEGNVVQYAQEYMVHEPREIEKVFEDAVDKHFEGIVAKKTDGVYEAGMRGWNWIKFKKAMSKKLMDTVDVVVLGYTLGEGKRTDFGVGQFLTGLYDEKRDVFVSVTKVGTGLTDEQFREFIRRVKPLEVREKPARYDIDKLLTPDVWVEPKLVVELGSDEISRSAVHTAGREMEPSKSGKAFAVKTPGFALRFPRLIRFRDDKSAEEATSVEEIQSMFKKQAGR